MDHRSSTTSVVAAAADAQQASRNEPANASEAPANAATSVCMLAECARESEAMPSCAANEDAVQGPKLCSESPITVCHDACSAQAEQTSLDSAESQLCASEMHGLQAPNTHLSEASAERDAYQGVSKVCTHELPFCDLKHSLDMVWLPGKDERLPVCDLSGVSNLLCCPFTKVGFMTASQRL